MHTAGPEPTDQRRWRYLPWLALLISLLLLLALFRFSQVTGFLGNALVKDPERAIPAGNVVVAPADGTVLYVREIRDGIIPQVVKQGVSVPVFQHLKFSPIRPVRHAYLIGIYMSTQGVHINRAPLAGEVVGRHVFNGPHMDMTATETTVILTQMIPGWIELKKWLGLAPFAIEQDADYILKSARDVIAIRDSRDRFSYLVRIADYSIGRILTWVVPGQQLATGERLGMITWGSQTDLLIESSPGMSIEIDAGDQVRGGESVLARY